MLSGTEDLVKADRMVLRFVAAAVGHTVSRELASSLVRDAAMALRARYPQLTPRLLDGAIWSHQSKLAAEARTGVSVTNATADGTGDAAAATIAKLEKELAALRARVAPTPPARQANPATGDVENRRIGRIPFVDWPEIARIVDEVGRQLQAECGDVSMSTTDLKRAIDKAVATSVHRAALPKPDWTLPTDLALRQQWRIFCR